MRSPFAVSLLAALPTLAAQSPLTTTWAGGNGLPGGNVAVWFDLDVQVPLLVHQLDVSAIGGAGAAAIEFWTCPVTWVGNDANPAAWTLRGSSAVVAAAPQGTATVAPLQVPFALPAGPFGVAIVHAGTLGPSYTNGNGVNQVWSTAELTLTAGASGGIFTGAVHYPRVWNGSIHYTVPGGVVATRAAYGNGCVAQPASCFEHFASAGAFDLANGGFSLLPAAGGYQLVPLQAAFVPPAATAPALALGDDTDTAVTLAAPFAFPGGSTSSLVVCSNGFVSAGAGNGQGYAPVPAAMLAMPRAVWSCWHDYNPAFPGSGPVVFEQDGGLARVTWNGVLGYAGTGAGSQPSTFQLQFDLASGAVHYVFGAMDGLGGSAYGDDHVIGWSPGGPSLDPGPTDLSALAWPGRTLPGQDLLPLQLAASARPVAGTTIALDTTGIPAGTPFGAVLLGTAVHQPGIDLTGLGMPGCRRYTDAVANFLFVAPGTSHALLYPVPAAVGVTLQAQAAVYAPQAALTPLGALSSNGLSLTIGSL